MFRLLAFFPLLWMIRSDFRERRIGLAPLLIFGTVVFLLEVWLVDWKVCIFRIVENGLVLMFLAIGIFLYLFMKYRHWVNPLQGAIGEGDICFLFCLMPAFEILEFTWFLVSASSLSLLASLLFRGWRERGVPLVTTLGTCYILYTLYKVVL